MIFHDKKAVFFHAGKTAGTSVERWLAPECPIDPMSVSEENQRRYCFGWNDTLRCFLQHLTPQDVIDQKYLSWEEFRNYYRFTVVRNPIERLASVYRYNQNLHTNYKTFDSFCQNLQKEYYCRHVRGAHLTRQIDYATFEDHRLINVFFFEDLDQMSSTVGKDLGVSSPFPHENRRQTTTPFDYSLSKLGLENIFCVYERDFEAFYPKLNTKQYLA